MGGGRSKKRKHAQFAQDMAAGDHNLGVGATLAHIRGEHQSTTDNQAVKSRSGSEEWTAVGKGGKKLKKTNYPSLGYSELHKLQASVNVHQLQGLILYCLADGTSPQWVSVRHHGMVQKAVVLFVPGLEKGMFDGSIELESPEEDLIDLAAPVKHVTGSANGTEEDLIDLSEPGVHSNGSVKGPEEDLIDLSEAHEIANPFISDPNSSKPTEVVVANILALNKPPEAPVIKSSSMSPDDYVPTLLVSEKLPSPLKSLADVFTHLWPVKAPGDDKYGKVHSPLHTMLNSPLTRTQEEKREDKRIKRPKPPRER